MRLAGELSPRSVTRTATSVSVSGAETFGASAKPAGIAVRRPAGSAVVVVTLRTVAALVSAISVQIFSVSASVEVGGVRFRPVSTS